jgi:hypothetical protein
LTGGIETVRDSSGTGVKKLKIITQLGGKGARLTRERKTVTAMLGIYCRDHHGPRNGLCEACSQLHDYAMCRLDRCPYGADKPTCAACPIHCYRADRRQEIRAVMRYAGPRMLWRHPWLAVRHLLDGRRPDPTKTGRGG